MILVQYFFTDPGICSESLWVFAPSINTIVKEKKSWLVGNIPWNQPGCAWILLYRRETLFPNRKGPEHENAQDYFWEESPVLKVLEHARIKKSYIGAAWCSFHTSWILRKTVLWDSVSLLLKLYNLRRDLQKFFKVWILAVWNTCHKLWLSGICQIFSSQKRIEPGQQTMWYLPKFLVPQEFSHSWLVMCSA